ncbi:MAG: hypothetical protein OEU46_01440 [Alphaproteobacteria bacterium]|nr:hypothetical protein [Alphaproteobacteria bacterium]
MAMKCGFRQIVACAVCALFLVVFAGLPAHAANARDMALAERIAKTYGVTVLKITNAEQSGKQVLLIAVMNPGGNFNEAFQVTNLVVDRQTGRLISQFPHAPTGGREAGPITPLDTK